MYVSTLGIALKFDEIKVGMKVIIPDYNSQRDNEFEIVTVRELNAGMGGVLDASICDQWFLSEESNYVIPYFDGSIFPLTKRMKTQLLLEGKLDDSSNSRKSKRESQTTYEIPN